MLLTQKLVQAFSDYNQRTLYNSGCTGRNYGEELRSVNSEYQSGIRIIDCYLSRNKPWDSAFAAVDENRINRAGTAAPPTVSRPAHVCHRTEKHIAQIMPK